MELVLYSHDFGIHFSCNPFHWWNHLTKHQYNIERNSDQVERPGGLAGGSNTRRVKLFDWRYEMNEYDNGETTIKKYSFYWLFNNHALGKNKREQNTHLLSQM